MKYVANILTDKPFEDKELYNIVSDKSELIEGIPTLVVGWEFTQFMYPDADIIDWQIDENTFWTFGKREKRSVYEDRCKRFREEAIDRYIKSVKYQFFSILTERNEIKEEFFKQVDAEKDVKVYLTGNMLYVLMPSQKTVYGIYLNDISYIGKSVKQFLSIFHRMENVEFVDISDTLSQDAKFAFRNCKYIIPYLVS